MGRDTLHNLVEIVDEKEIETVYRILLKFVAEDAPLPDEVIAIQEARKDIVNGELFMHEEAWA